MRPLSSLVALTCLAAVTLLVIVLGCAPQQPTEPATAAKPRNAPAKPVEAEVANATPSAEEKGAEEEAPPLDIRDAAQVRLVFHVMDFDARQEKERQQLIEAGEKAFPAYEAILSDPKATPQEVGGVFFLLHDVEADRRRFLKHAVSRLTDRGFGVRLNAVHLLREIRPHSR
jgi:hypothetical protein